MILGLEFTGIFWSISNKIIFGQFLKLTQSFAEKAGISTDQQRMDSTLFMSNIKKAGRLALAFDVLYKAVKSIPENHLTENLKEVLTPEFKTQTIYKSKPFERRLCIFAKEEIKKFKKRG